MAEFAILLKFPYVDERSLAWHPTATRASLGLSLYASCPVCILSIQS